MSLNSQPSEVLDFLLNQTGLPFSQRLRLRVVSQRVCDILENGLAKEMSLSLWMKETAPDKLAATDLVLKPTTADRNEQIFQLLARLFPGIINLSVHFRDSLWKELTIFFDKVINLRSLKLDGLTICPIDERTNFKGFKVFAKSLNSLARLKSLDLEVMTVSSSRFRFLRATLSRLERFRFRDFLFDAVAADDEGIEEEEVYQASFIASALSSRCTHLEIDYVNFDGYNGPFIRRLSNLKHFHLRDCYEACLKPVSKLTQLTSLILNFRTYMFELSSTMLRKLGRLTQLSELTLDGLSHYPPLKGPSKKRSPLSSVRRLSIGLIDEPNYEELSEDAEFNVEFDAKVFLLAIGRWFPGLRNFTFRGPASYHQKIEANRQYLNCAIALRDLNYM